jgi:hypothetical protein
MPEPHIRVVVEHAVEEESTTVTVSYGGGAFDPRTTDNELSLKMLKGASGEISYSYDPEAARQNKVLVRLSPNLKKP